jgi:hypothetical protein
MRLLFLFAALLLVVLVASEVEIPDFNEDLYTQLEASPVATARLTAAMEAGESLKPAPRSVKTTDPHTIELVRQFAAYRDAKSK